MTVTLDKVRELYDAGMSETAIAKALGLTRYQVFTLAGVVRVERKAEERRRLAEAQVVRDTRDLTAKFCGDPLPGRSALDRRQST